MTKIYTIRTVEDLIPLDDRQLDACLADLKTWVQFRKKFDASVQQMRSMITKETGLSGAELDAAIGVEIQDHMAWIDDGIEGGKVNLEVSVRNPDGSITQVADIPNAFAVDVNGNAKPTI